LVQLEVVRAQECKLQANVEKLSESELRLRLPNDEAQVKYIVSKHKGEWSDDRGVMLYPFSTQTQVDTTSVKVTELQNFQATTTGTALPEKRGATVTVGAGAGGKRMRMLDLDDEAVAGGPGRGAASSGAQDDWEPSTNAVLQNFVGKGSLTDQLQNLVVELKPRVTELDKLLSDFATFPDYQLFLTPVLQKRLELLSLSTKADLSGYDLTFAGVGQVQQKQVHALCKTYRYITTACDLVRALMQGYKLDLCDAGGAAPDADAGANGEEKKDEEHPEAENKGEDKEDDAAEGEEETKEEDDATVQEENTEPEAKGAQDEGDAGEDAQLPE
jgi:hypothetical protein